MLKLFKEGFAVDAGPAHFIDSTLGCPTREALLGMVEDPGSDAAVLLFDLVIAPDDRIRRAVEACLARWPGAVADVRAVVGLLPETLPTVLLFSDSRGEIPCRVPAAVARHLVARLNLSKAVDSRVHGAIEEALNKPEDRLAVLAILRGSRVDLGGPAVPFLAAFIRRSPGNDMPLFSSLLRLLLHILERPGASDGLFEALETEQAACLSILYRATQLEKRLAQDNMETLMLQGGRGLLSADTGELQQRLGMLNAVCLAVFGRPLPAEPVEDPVNVSWDKTV